MTNLLQLCKLCMPATSNYLVSFFSIVEELYYPVHGCQQTGPSVRASHSKQGTLADLKGVLEVLEQLWNILLHLAEGLHIWIHLTQQELNYAEDILAHGTGQCLRRHSVLISMSAQVLYELTNAVMLVGLVADRPRILFRACHCLAVSAGPALNA
jgi:hypothetical protein